MKGEKGNEQKDVFIRSRKQDSVQSESASKNTESESKIANSSKTIKKLTIPAIYKPINLDREYKNYELSATFREFVLYLIDPNNTVFPNDVIDHGSGFLKWTSVRHWMPFYELSCPCHIDYDVIAHMETIDDDARYLLHLIKAPPDLHYPKGYNQQSGGSTTSSTLLRDLFATLSNDEKKKLVDRYSFDYKLFGYEMPVFDFKKSDP